MLSIVVGVCVLVCVELGERDQGCDFGVWGGTLVDSPWLLGCHTA